MQTLKLAIISNFTPTLVKESETDDKPRLHRGPTSMLYSKTITHP